MAGQTWKTSVLERFLRYVVIDTQSQEDSATYPSTAKQLDLLRLLVAERWANASYSVAQFMRTDDETTDAAFALAVECEPAEGGEPAGGE